MSGRHRLERDDFSSNRHPALSFCLSMISGQTLCVCPEGKPVPTFPDHALPRTRMPGRQHADKSADVGVPDIAIAIDGDAERPGIVAGERKDRDLAVAQPPEAGAAQHAEPDVVIGSHGNAAETGIFLTRLDIRKLAILESPDAI